MKFKEIVIYSGPTDRINAPPTGQNLANPLAFQGGSYNTLLEVLSSIRALGACSVHVSCPFAPAEPRWDVWTGLQNPAAHGFWPKNFRELNHRFGSQSELRRFIRSCQAAEMKVIGEMTFHFGPGASFPEGWATPREDWCMGVLPRLNLRNPEVRAYVLQTVDWFADMGFWGIRLDTAFELPSEFLGAVIATAQRRGLFLIGEVFDGDPTLVQGLLKGVHWTDYPMNFSMFEVLAGKGSVEQLHALLAHPYSREQSLATFVDNHDVASFVRECVRRSSDPGNAIKYARARMLMALSLIMVVRGVPTIYYLDSWALNLEGMADPLGSNRLPAPWGQRPILETAIARLSTLRHTRPELAHGTYRELWLPGPRNVWAFAKIGLQSTVVLLNNEDEAVDLTDLGGIDAQGLLPDGTIHCLLRPGKSFVIEGGRISGVLAPRSVYLLGN
ncbi:alpha-amylase family glycosyl hydrolase [Deinococcus koreensis]|uniref:Glycosyl hydrolase family 13 catalytic domain-containing protein n=1 Tax=Deinococcus koreensis TaxID=2054903 RepID=A0A2K3UT04_9DEIO|nr:alpha-amylase family glycosyl hydrolase [Deinococcus koreensis]PNY79672.1 hypothetical protein CVO96_17050 [Deinococcus koreensis]